MPTKVHEATTLAPVDEAGANGAQRDRGDVVSSLDDILAIDDIRYETVYVPEWQRSIRLVGLTGEGRNKVFQAGRADIKRLGEDAAELLLQARVVLASMVDADGSHIGDPSQAKALMQKSGAALTRLWLVCVRLSGIGGEGEEEAVADLKGTPSADTGSD
jgi:hypothetical protein